MDRQTEKLLIEIQAALLCQYLSNLHSAATLFDTKAKQLVLEIPDSRYSSTAWSEAISYITGKASTFDTVSEAKKAIMKR